MAASMITVGLNTNRSYNKKNPPGGKCTDFFGGAEEGASDRRPSTQEEKPVETPKAEQQRTQKRSQPSVCPVTGETYGIAAAPKPAAVEQEAPASESPSKAVPPPAKAPANAPTP